MLVTRHKIGAFQNPICKFSEVSKNNGEIVLHEFERIFKYNLRFFFLLSIEIIFRKPSQPLLRCAFYLPCTVSSSHIIFCCQTFNTFPFHLILINCIKDVRTEEIRNTAIGSCEIPHKRTVKINIRQPRKNKKKRERVYSRASLDSAN